MAQVGPGDDSNPPQLQHTVTHVHQSFAGVQALRPAHSTYCGNYKPLPHIKEVYAAICTQGCHSG
jgi:hypothetical protein